MKTKLLLALGVFLTALVSSHAQTINPGIIDPTDTYAGKTYSGWSAGWWQYYMSLPATNNPFVYNPPFPVSPLSTGQSGPVWFICGNYANGGTHIYTNSVPGGIGLFMLITDIEEDNAYCPSPTSYSEAQLRAFAKTTQNYATNMICTIDGIAVGSLTNVMTTPYRIQSTLFSYTCPAVHNILHDFFGDLCYQNRFGIPYTVNGAVEDGVFLLIAPLSAGPHIIHKMCAYLALSPPYFAEFTYYLTVGPVALTADATAQPGNLVLSWPQTPDNYTLQASPALSPSDWQPVNLVISTNNGILQATAPIGPDSQYFRLQLN